MRLPRLRCSVRSMMLVVATLAVILGVGLSYLRWFMNPSIEVRIINETNEALTDVRLLHHDYYGGTGMVGRVAPGAVVHRTIRCTSEGTIEICFRKAGGQVFSKDADLYVDSQSRGSLAFHVTPTGVTVVKTDL
jgi:hypothetical protein